MSKIELSIGEDQSGCSSSRSVSILGEFLFRVTPSGDFEGINSPGFLGGVYFLGRAIS